MEDGAVDFEDLPNEVAHRGCLKDYAHSQATQLPPAWKNYLTLNMVKYINFCKMLKPRIL